MPQTALAAAPHDSSATVSPWGMLAVIDLHGCDRERLADLIGPKTTGFLLMSPSMPSVGYLDEDDWLAVCHLCRERDLFLIYDSAMERLLFDSRPLVHPLRMDGMVERTVVVGSL